MIRLETDTDKGSLAGWCRPSPLPCYHGILLFHKFPDNRVSSRAEVVASDPALNRNRSYEDHVMACTASTSPTSHPHPNLAAYRAALRGIIRLKRLQAQTAAIEAGQMAEGL